MAATSAKAAANAVSEPPPEGAIRAGDCISAYRVQSVIGTGGMGWVYRARHALTEREVALKVLREDQIGMDRAVDRMMREATILASVSHPGLPKFYECGLLPDGRPWIAMEYVQGQALSARIHDGAIIPPAQVMHLVKNVTDVLAACHARGFTHRDLKPDNIFLTPDDPLFPVRVIDWGIAHAMMGERFTNMNEAIGTPTYMAPEQARGGPTNGHADVYGLAVVAFQALTGRAPFIGQTSVEILVQHLNRRPPELAPRCPDAPTSFVVLVERMLEKKFEDRPSAEEVYASLAKLERAATEPGTIAFEIEDDDTGIPMPIVGDDTGATAALRAPRVTDDE
jgi:serine/threonine protein kinase